MQRYHRNRHRMLWAFLLPLGILLILIALISRPHWPRMDALPGLNSSVTELQSSE